jgi:hypothetical protein
MASIRGQFAAPVLSVAAVGLTVSISVAAGGREVAGLLDAGVNVLELVLMMLIGESGEWTSRSTWPSKERVGLY